MDIRFDGQKALVTGAGKGIGLAIAKALAKGGAEVWAVSRTQADLDTLCAQQSGVHPVLLDVSDVTETRTRLEVLPPMDLLVNNAGVASLQPFLETSVEEFDRIMSVNVRGVFLVSQLIARGMVKAGRGGAIVNLSSVASSCALTDHTAYCTSKGAVDQLTRMMSLELGPHKIRVNSVNPTVVLTDMGKLAWSDPAKGGPLLARIPTGKFIEVDEVVDAVMYLLSSRSGSINGITMPIDGGLLAN